MQIVECLACQVGDHDNHYRVIQPVFEGVIGGAECHCEGECRKGREARNAELVEVLQSHYPPPPPGEGRMGINAPRTEGFRWVEGCGGSGRQDGFDPSKGPGLGITASRPCPGCRHPKCPNAS